jgi:hypothetical protein
MTILERPLWFLISAFALAMLALCIAIGHALEPFRREGLSPGPGREPEENPDAPA